MPIHKHTVEKIESAADVGLTMNQGYVELVDNSGCANNICVPFPVFSWILTEAAAGTRLAVDNGRVEKLTPYHVTVYFSGSWAARISISSLRKECTRYLRSS